ncbi:MAG TPA: sugar phosphate isomerase/epimerase family protein [Urbifossiella sp.]|nr:sugar phosphate isomerase/epimerase family protein [Urbifossiella sp.]
MAKARISIGTWAYIFNQEQPTNDFHVILHKLQDLGYDGVELGSFGPHPSPASHPTRASRQKLRKEIADHGLALSGIAVDLWAFKTPGTSIMDEIPAAYLTAFLGWCVFASELDAKTIRVDTVIGPTYFETDPEGKKLGAEKGMDRIVNAWDKCSKIAADYGLNVCWEFEPGFAFNKPSEIVKLVDGVRAKGNNNFGVLYDTCHAHMVAVVGANQAGTKETLPGGEVELLDKLKGKVTHIHLIDSDGSLNEHNTSTHNPFGTGKLNFDALVPAMQKCGVPHDWWTVDLCFWPHAWEVTAQSKKFLDKLRAKYAAA